MCEQGRGSDTRVFSYFAAALLLSPTSVAEELLISTNGAKELHLKNLTLEPGSVSHIGPSQTRVADSVTWTLRSNATLLVEGGATLYAERPADLQGTPAMRVEGVLRFQGRPGERAASTLQIVNLARVEVANRALLNADGSELAVTAATDSADGNAKAIQPFEAAFSGGLDSSADSVLDVRASALLTSSCHQNMTGRVGCTLGGVTGPGHLALQMGRHTMISPMNVSHLTLANGHALALKRLRLDRFDVLDGMMTLHEYAFVKEVSGNSPCL